MVPFPFINRFLVILVLIISFANKANASGWDAFINCLIDPCNCGISDKERYEWWDDKRQYKGHKNYICPPWNKDGGRDDHICLAGQDYPPNFTGFFQKICAESTRESNFFEPKIRIRDQECNAVACWTTENTLKWDGDCKTLAGPYGLPLTRMCARIAIPGDARKGIPADPGYTQGMHLNYEGVTKKDETPLGADGQPIVFRLPKLCVYLDPAFIGTGDEGLDIDLIDLSPSHQPLHKTKELHPVIKVIIFFFDIATQTFQSPFVMLAQLFDMLIGAGGDGPGPMEILANIFNHIGLIIQLVGMIIIEILKEIGQMNRVVSPNIYGCVIIPLGPFPPPFCQHVAPLFETAATQNICTLGDDGLPVKSTEEKPCVVSSLVNNFIRNSIRIGYDNFMPLCANGENPMTTDRCISIENMDSFHSAAGMHVLTAKKDIIKPCGSASPGAPCIRSKNPLTCSVSSNGCNQGFRITYASTIGKFSNPSNYFRDDLPDCPSTSSVSCQSIWGINTGEFIDIALRFPSVQAATDIGPISTTFSLTSKNKAATSFSASIVRGSTFLSTYEFTQDPSKICVFDPISVVGCEDRAAFITPSVYSCASGTGGINCSTDYFKPSFIASISAGSDSVSALVQPLTTFDDPNAINNSTVNLAGYEFDSFVTDDTFVVKPFSGSKSPNAASIFGTYINNVSPVNDDGSVNNDAIYIKGLEYVNNAYLRGGKFACLEQHTDERCPSNTNLCVLTSLANNNIVDCSTFIGKSTTYGGLAVCGPDLSGCNLAEHLPGLSGGAGINIYKCTGKPSCYVSPVTLCGVTNDPASRITPSPSFGDIIPSSQFYDINGTPGYYYNKKVSALRNKTPLEMNLCTSIPQPAPCAAVASSGPDSASWTSAAMGEYSTGTCPSGNPPLKPMRRYCLLNSNSKKVELQDLGSGPECKVGP